MSDVLENRLGRLLRKAGLIDEQSLALAQSEALARQRKLAEIVIDLGFVDERALAELIAREGDIPVASPIDREAARKLAKRVPAHLARKHMAVPIDGGGDMLVVAMIDPFEAGAVEILESTTGSEIRVAVGLRSEVERAVIEIYGVGEEADITLFSQKLALDLWGDENISEFARRAHDLFEIEANDEAGEGADDDANRTIHSRPTDSSADESTAPTVTRETDESSRVAHIERQLIGIMRSLALIQARLDAIDAKIAPPVESSRISR